MQLTRTELVGWSDKLYRLIMDQKHKIQRTLYLGCLVQIETVAHIPTAFVSKGSNKKYLTSIKRSQSNSRVFAALSQSRVHDNDYICMHAYQVVMEILTAQHKSDHVW